MQSIYVTPKLKSLNVNTGAAARMFQNQPWNTKMKRDEWVNPRWSQPKQQLDVNSLWDNSQNNQRLMEVADQSVMKVGRAWEPKIPEGRKDQWVTEQAALNTLGSLSKRQMQTDITNVPEFKNESGHKSNIVQRVLVRQWIKGNRQGKFSFNTNVRGQKQDVRLSRQSTVPTQKQPEFASDPGRQTKRTLHTKPINVDGQLGDHLKWTDRSGAQTNIVRPAPEVDPQPLSKETIDWSAAPMSTTTRRTQTINRNPQNDIIQKLQWQQDSGAQTKIRTQEQKPAVLDLNPTNLVQTTDQIVMLNQRLPPVKGLRGPTAVNGTVQPQKTQNTNFLTAGVNLGPLKVAYDDNNVFLR